MFRSRLAALCLLPVLGALAACSTTDPFGPEPATRQVETIETRTVYTEDGPVTTTTHSVRDEEIPRVPEQDIAGFWTLQISGATGSCLIDLKINAIEDSLDRQADATEICDLPADTIAGWRLVNGRIVLRDIEGQILGSFQPPSSGEDYDGFFKLSDDERADATIRKTA
jgi:hypothetical protein